MSSVSVASLVGGLRRAGVNRAVGFTVLGRGWTALAGLMTLVLMTRFLSPVQQGYYFTFGSVLALSVFFELGLSIVLVQFASHERAALTWTPRGTLEGDPGAKARLASLLRMSLTWYGAAAALLVAVVMPLGIVFFGRLGHPGILWQGPWVWIIIVTGLSMALTPALAVIEGSGLIAEIARLQLWQNIAGSLLLWLALAAHWGLFAAPVTNTVSLICLAAWLAARKKVFLTDLLRARSHPAHIDWLKEVWPLQWKVGLSYISGYFLSQLFNPLLFATHGAVAAGQMGLSLTIMGTVSAISLAWVATKAAPFGTLIAGKDYAGLDRLFFPCLWQSWTLVTALAAAVWGAVTWLHAAHLPLGGRFLSPFPLGLLALVVVTNHLIYAEAIYLRAHKQEPVMAASLVSALLIGGVSLLVAAPFGATGLMLANFVICLFSLAVITRIFMQKRRLWHETACT